MNSGVVSFGFAAFSGSGASCVLGGAAFNELLLPANLYWSSLALAGTYCTVRNMRFQRRPSTRFATLCARLESLSDGSSPVRTGGFRSIDQ